jgi:hypothetical protein
VSYVIVGRISKPMSSTGAELVNEPDEIMSAPAFA